VFSRTWACRYGSAVFLYHFVFRTAAWNRAGSHVCFTALSKSALSSLLEFRNESVRPYSAAISLREISGIRHRPLYRGLTPTLLRGTSVARRAIPARPVVPTQVADLHARPRLGSVDVLAATDVDADMVSTRVPGRVVPEHQIPHLDRKSVVQGKNGKIGNYIMKKINMRANQ